eukprot:9496712-Pyramimonas_sp.AAC.1
MLLLFTGPPVPMTARVHSTPQRAFLFHTLCPVPHFLPLLSLTMVSNKTTLFSTGPSMPVTARVRSIPQRPLYSCIHRILFHPNRPMDRLALAIVVVQVTTLWDKLEMHDPVMRDAALKRMADNTDPGNSEELVKELEQLEQDALKQAAENQRVVKEDYMPQ